MSAVGVIVNAAAGARDVLATGRRVHQLLAAVKRTRDLHKQGLGGRVDRSRVNASRHHALAALEAYVAALERWRLPVPPGVRMDLELFRGLCGSIRRTTSG